MEKLDILFLDNHLLVVDKPAGVLIQADRTCDESLLEACRLYLKHTFHKPGNVFLGLVHRLDRPASGVVVFARTSKAAARLSEQFRNRNVKKIYWALVEGKVPLKGTLVNQIVRNGATSYVGEGSQSKKAELSFHRLDYKKGISWVEINLCTGRHHQIRVQFAHCGHMILGDLRYGSKQRFGEKALALHARSLTLSHPTKGEAMTFIAKPDSAWSAYCS